ncbi:fasciclin domain family, partial [Aspergillus sclerotialis]
LARCRSTRKFASLVKQDKTLVNILNTVSLDHTVFAPTDQAFDEFPGNLSSFSKEDIRALVLYHVSPGLVSLDALLEAGGGTVPTLLNQSVLGEDGLAQRVDFRVDVEGEGEVVLGYKSEGRVVTGDIPATNGFLHLITSVLLPPPPTVAILNSLPTEFSTFTLALIKTGLYRTLSQIPNTTAPSKGAAGNLNRTTLFTPPNTAFESLHSSIPEFLFSTEEGTKYLRALLEYHIVANFSLFSDVLYTDEGEVVEFKDGEGVSVELPTLLGGGNCSVLVDVGGDGNRDGGDGDEIETKTKPDRVKGEMITVNGVEVTTMDSVTRYGVMHVIDRILIPGGWDEDEKGKLTVEELKERLKPWIKDGDDKIRNVLDVDHLEL